jgi:tRNA uridine 5-carboxymethylaminomethyl modification enzyme
MFTSRAEYRLLLRHDNADRRLTALGRKVGSVSVDEWARYCRKEQGIVELQEYLKKNRSDGDSLETWLRRTGQEWPDLCARHPALSSWDARADVVEQVVLEAKYSGYVERQASEVERFRRMEHKRIPTQFEYAAIPQLRHEAREKLTKIRPASLGQASRISGITPADLAVLLFYLE